MQSEKGSSKAPPTNKPKYKTSRKDCKNLERNKVNMNTPLPIPTMPHIKSREQEQDS